VKILEKYLFLMIFKSSISVLFSLLLIFSFFQFLREIDEIGNANYGLYESAKYILLLMPSYMNALLVLAIMIGTIFSLGKLNENKEIQIFLTASVSLKMIIKNGIKYSVIISIFFIVLLESISPQAAIFANQVKAESLGKSTYYESNQAWLKKDDKILFLVPNKKNKFVAKIFITDGSNLSGYISSNKAYFSNSSLILDESEVIEFANKEGFKSPTKKFSKNFSEYNLDVEEIETLSKKVNTMSFFEILDRITFSYKNQTQYQDLMIELISRVIKPFTLIGMILLATPFVLNLQRNISAGNRVFIAVAIGTITHLITKIFSVFTLKFDSISFIGPMLPAIIIISLGLVVMNRKLKA